MACSLTLRMRIERRKLFIVVGLIAVGVCMSCAMAVHAGRILVIDQPEYSDVIVVLFGGLDDLRERRGLELLRKGYARALIVDVPDRLLYGHKEPEEALKFLRENAPDQAGRVHVCKFSSDSTRLELGEINKCMHALVPEAHAAIVVTSNYHTRRALTIARNVLKQFQWSAAAASDPEFDVDWWHREKYAKTLVIEWQKLLWWSVIEQWTSNDAGK